MITTQYEPPDSLPARPAKEGSAPDVTNHAKLRWFQRSEMTELRVEEAWRQGYYVGCDDYIGKARLHSPSGVVLIEKDGVITTVLDTANISYTIDHLVECRHCEFEYKPDSDNQACPWCMNEQGEVGQ